MKRYHKQELVKWIGKEGQQKISQASIAIIGIGALGTVVAELAARAGIGTIVLYDYDIVDQTNLQRQHLFTEEDIDQLKVIAAQKHLNQINHEITIISQPLQIDQFTLPHIKADIIVECSDNLKTKTLVNDFALAKNIPLVIGTAAGTKGYVLGVEKSIGCFRDVFPLPKVFDTTTTIDDCTTLGVVNTLTTTIGSFMFQLVLKKIIEGKFPAEAYYLDIWTMNVMPLQRKPQCKACQRPQQFYKEQWQEETTTQLKALCGNERYAYKGRFSLATMKKLLPEAKKKGNVLYYKEFIILANQILFPASSQKAAEKKIQQFLRLIKKHQ